MPVSMHSSTLWTVKSAERKLLETQKVALENAEEGKISFEVNMSIKLEDLPEASTPTSLTSPKPENDCGCPNKDLTLRRHSAPALPHLDKNTAKHPQGLVQAKLVIKGGLLMVENGGKQQPRRGSLPPLLTERLLKFGSCSSDKSSGSDRIQEVGVS